MKTKRIYFETEDTVVTNKKGWISFEMDYTQIYSGVFTHTKDLKSKYCTQYLLWIIDKASDMNMIPHNEYILNQFCNEFKEKPSIGTVRNAVSELVKNKLLIKYSNNSYQLNPVVFWNDETAKRIEHIKGLENTKDIDFQIVQEDTVKYLKK